MLTKRSLVEYLRAMPDDTEITIQMEMIGPHYMACQINAAEKRQTVDGQKQMVVLIAGDDYYKVPKALAN